MADGLYEFVVWNNLLPFDNPDAWIAQESLAERVGVGVGCLEGLLDLGGDGHATGRERAIAEGAVIAQKEANARTGDLTQLGEEYLSLRLVKRRRIQGCQKLGVGLGGDHVCMVTK